MLHKYCKSEVLFWQRIKRVWLYVLPHKFFFIISEIKIQHQSQLVKRAKNQKKVTIIKNLVTTITITTVTMEIVFTVIPTTRIVGQRLVIHSGRL